MRGRIWLAFLAALVIVGAAVYLSPVNALQQKPAKEVAQASIGSTLDAPLPGDDLQPVNHCSGCVSSFCAALKVRCTATGECCAGKSHGNCEYTCACDDTCTTINIPSNACYTLPSEDCACHHVLCKTSYCKFQDFLCDQATCVNGCCTYSNCHEEACNVEACPPNACPGTCP